MRGLLLALALLSLGVASACGRPFLSNIPGLQHLWKLFAKTADVVETTESSYAAGLRSELPHAESVRNQAATKAALQFIKKAQPSNQPDNLPRQHKASFVDYPTARRVYQSKKKTTTAKKQKQRKKDSAIHFIKLPPAPYSYVPGLGYISRPPSFSASALAAAAQEETAASVSASMEEPRPRPPPPPPSPPSSPPPSHADPTIKLPIEFVSNGKPISVQHWHSPIGPNGGKQPNRAGGRPPPDSPVIRLNRGPYVFNGRPTSVYDLKRTARPDGPNRV